MKRDYHILGGDHDSPVLLTTTVELPIPLPEASGLSP